MAEPVHDKWCVADNPGNVWESYARQGKKIGAGGFGFVFRANSSASGTAVAIKTVPKLNPLRAEPQSVPERLRQLRRRDAQKLKEEICTMRKLDHQNIVRLFETFEDRNYVYLVMELCEGGELVGLILEHRTLNEACVAMVMRQVLAAIEYMHSKLICHRDIKQENIVFLSRRPIEQNTLKVVDFGLACRFKPGQSLSLCAGTVLYVAPQVIDGKYDHAVDLWSCGVLLYLLLCGYPPFLQDTDAATLALIKRGNYSFPSQDWSAISDAAKNLVRSLLKLKPKDRCTAKAAVEHQWVKNGPEQGASVDLRCALDKLRKFVAYQHRTQDDPGEYKVSADKEVIDRQKAPSEVASSPIGSPCSSPSQTSWFQGMQDQFAALTGWAMDNAFFSVQTSNGKEPSDLARPQSCSCQAEEIKEPIQIVPLPSVPADEVVPSIHNARPGADRISHASDSSPVADSSPVPATTFIGESVQFYSKSAARWLSCEVTDVGADGAIIVSVKPGAWISTAQQQTRIRRQGGQVQRLAEVTQAPSDSGEQPDWYVGQKAEYLSVSAGRWIACVITGVNECSSVQVDVKPGYWIPLHHQSSHLRARHGSQSKASVITMSSEGDQVSRSVSMNPSTPGYAATKLGIEHGLGSDAEYFSMALRTWIPCKVTNRDHDTGNIMVDALRKAWLTPEQQSVCLRRASQPERLLRVPMIGDRVVYHSSSHKRWLPTIINDVNELDGIELEIKPGVWITREQQILLVRWREEFGTHEQL
eukprot:TRINITY_DN13147_c0_g1_i3.p1 TRINITY_DN13147_c0_g1~~TRINITY_DN13147_c0_g1_i3.p1  ORF type:complete len:757 (-),score=111.69 TRINITY_DN13147_c0_g1_i3:217-2487(-)